MNAKYAIEIYYPGSTENVWVSYYSDSPFLAISKGDMINPAHFADASAEAMLRVTSVEHIVWSEPDQQPKHKICIYTEDIEDSSARFGF
jgi:hypothetical protein